jgi:hypothetical protein
MLTDDPRHPLDADALTGASLHAVLADTLKAARDHDLRQFARDEALLQDLSTIERHLAQPTSLKNPLADTLEELGSRLECEATRAKSLSRWSALPLPRGLVLALALSSALAALLGSFAGLQSLRDTAACTALALVTLSAAHWHLRRSALAASRELDSMQQRALAALSAARLLPEVVPVDADTLRRAAQRLRVRHTTLRAIEHLREIRARWTPSAPSADLFLALSSYERMSRGNSKTSDPAPTAPVLKGLRKPQPSSARPVLFPRVMSADAS